MENLRADRNAFTIAFRIRAESCSSTSNVRFFNCEFETTVLNPFWPSGGAYEPYYAFRIEFALRKGTGDEIWLYDNRQGKDIFRLKVNGQPAQWHTVWGTCELPPYPYTTTNCVYRLWVDGTEVAWDDRDRGGWSDCEVGWTPTSGRYATFALDYLCYTYGAYPPGAIAIPAERVVAPTNSIATLKTYNDGTPCLLTNKVVMGIFTDPRPGTKFYYLCEPDGTDGIKVTHNTGKAPHNAGGSPVVLAIGDVVTVSGGLSSAEGEKQISAHDITYLSAGTSPAVPLSVSNADVTNSYNAALYADVPAQLLATAETGFLTSLTTTTMTDTSKTWAADQWKNMTVFLPATAYHPGLYYYVIANSANTLTLSHRTIRPDFNIPPNLVADGVLVGDTYEFVGGKPTGPRLDGRLVRTTGTVTAVNATAGYFDINDGGASGDTRTLQDIWDAIHYGTVFVPPNGIRVYAASPFPNLGDNVAAVGCAGTSRFKHQVSTVINGSARDEVKIDKVMPAVWGQKWAAAPTAGNNGPICEGSTLNLTASTVPDGTYAWTGPNGFTSSVQNPSIPNATTAASGEYGVSVTVNGCSSPPATTTVTVLAAPSIVHAPSALFVTAKQYTNPPPSTFTIRNGGGCTLTYSIADDRDWMSCNPTIGSSLGETDTIEVVFETAGLSPGTYQGAIMIEASEAINTPQWIAVTLEVRAAADFDNDGDVDLVDFAHFQACFNGPNRAYVSTGCENMDFDADDDVDLVDFGIFQACFNGPNRPPNCP